MEKCMNCYHELVFDGYNYKHNTQVESYCCTATKKFVTINKDTRRLEIHEIGCSCVDPKGKKHDLEYMSKHTKVPKISIGNSGLLCS